MTGYFDENSYDVLLAVSILDGRQWLDKHLLYKGSVVLVTVDSARHEGRIVRGVYVTDEAYAAPGARAAIEMLLRSRTTSLARFEEAPMVEMHRIVEPEPGSVQLGPARVGDTVRLIRAADYWGPRLRVGTLGKVTQLVDDKRLAVVMDDMPGEGPIVFWADRFAVVDRPLAPRERYRERAENVRPKRQMSLAEMLALPPSMSTLHTSVMADAMRAYARTQAAGETLYVIVPDYVPIVVSDLPGVEFVRPGDPRLGS